MADVVIGAKLEVDSGGAVNSVRNFKKELKEAQREVQVLSEKFGETSVEAANAAKKAAELKDKIQDAKTLTDAFNPDTKFRAFGSAINTVVGGFTALQGVMGLVGVESEAVQKSLLKVQSALAISQGVAQLQEGIKSFKNLSAVIQQTTIFQKANNAATTAATLLTKLFGGAVETTSMSFKVLKGAIAATGIGLLIVGIGELVSLFDKLANSAKKAAEEQQKALDARIEFLDKSLVKEKDKINQDEALAVARAKVAGESEAQLLEITQRFQRIRLASLKRTQEEANVNGQFDIELTKEIVSIENKIKVDALNFQAKENEKADAADKARREKRKAEILKDREDEIRLQAAQITGKVTIDPSQAGTSPEQLQFEAEVKARHDAREQEKIDLELMKAFKASNTQFNIDQSLLQMEQEELEHQHRQAIVQGAGDAFATLSNIAGKETAAGKVLAIASTTIKTYQSAVAAFAGMTSSIPGPVGIALGVVAAAGALASGIATVKKIIAVKVPGASGGSAPTMGAAPPPLVVPRPGATRTTLDQASLNAIGSATTRAFVLESDVTNNQEKIKRLNRAARI